MEDKITTSLIPPAVEPVSSADPKGALSLPYEESCK